MRKCNIGTLETELWKIRTVANYLEGDNKLGGYMDL
jgi:hypothetical protein